MIAKEVPEMTVGAGTVINVEQAALAVKNGAKFIVSPGLDEGVVIWAKENNIPVIPGCVTPSEIMKAIGLGLNVVKFFPADVFGGIKAIKALSAPFGQDGTDASCVFILLKYSDNKEYSCLTDLVVPGRIQCRRSRRINDGRF